MLRVGGIVLCGGRSRRMGVAKALLPFGGEPMLSRVVRLLGEIVSPIVVVAAADQQLPEMPAEVIVTRDEQPDRGPLEGLRAGLAALPAEVDAAYATSCDVPLLAADFVRRMIDELGENRIAVPREDRFHHPLAAVYRPDVLPVIEALLAEDRLRPVFLYEAVPTREVPVEDLRSVDPELTTLANLNHPEDYLAALAKAGLSPDEEVTRQLQGE